MLVEADNAFRNLGEGIPYIRRSVPLDDCLDWRRLAVISLLQVKNDFDGFVSHGLTTGRSCRLQDLARSF